MKAIIIGILVSTSFSTMANEISNKAHLSLNTEELSIECNQETLNISHPELTSHTNKQITQFYHIFKDSTACSQTKRELDVVKNNLSAISLDIFKDSYIDFAYSEASMNCNNDFCQIEERKNNIELFDVKWLGLKFHARSEELLNIQIVKWDNKNQCPPWNNFCDF